ncbi:AmmeMemoRadiSam system protein B [bacterium]|nr:AmmeMemoRadiSam system protein B [bacterium]
MVQRAPAVAGSFYPASPEHLRSEVSRLITLGEIVFAGDVIGLLAPHAGYIYSGSIAGSVYSTIVGKRYDTVVLVSPSHRDAFNFSSVLGEGSYETPLGSLTVDQSMATQLVQFDHNARLDDRGHRPIDGLGEHSLEVQLPFLQVALEDRFKIVPIVMGAQHDSAADSLGEAIAKAVRLSGKRVLLVASSDLSHFHAEEAARRLDDQIVQAIQKFSSQMLWERIESGQGEACGAGPIAAIMTAAKLLGADSSVVVDYGTSGDVPTADKESVVGYLSAAFLRKDEPG